MPSIHAIRWISQLEGKGFELYWFDILDRGTANFLPEVHQIINWKKNKFPLKGKTFLKEVVPSLYSKLQPYIEVTPQEEFERIIKHYGPDIIHSFEMQHCTTPLLSVMQSHPQLPWVYSCWGSDLFYYQNYTKEKRQLQEVLKRVNYIHTDCNRDYNLAKKLGFKGMHFGTFLAGGGFRLEKYNSYIQPLSERNCIVVKGYQHTFGRALTVLEAFSKIPEALAPYNLIIFSAHPVVVEAAVEMETIFNQVTVFKNDNPLPHSELLQWMGKSLVYIGNSISDGMPNTLIEAFIMGAFPIQSNPGGATEEVISHGNNGLLIDDPNNSTEISHLILKALNISLIENAYLENKQIIKEGFEFYTVQKKIIFLYKSIIKEKK